jgi:NAD(P)-dependent dehydrogenase (short-subunit alcohol dehydrogenase family)
MLGDFSISGKHILIVGATSGLGRAFSNHAAGEDSRLYLTGRNRVVLDELKRDYPHQVYLNDGCDIRSKEERINYISSIETQLNGVVFFSGITEYAPLRFQSEKSIDDVIDTNFTANILFLQELSKQKKIAPSASVVFLSSVSAQRGGSPGISIYAATKGAIESAVRVLSLEFAKSRVRINAIAPGLVMTPMMTQQTSLTPDQIKEQEKKYPLGYGKPDDISNLIHFLISDSSGWITGTTITIDGGYSNS